MKFIVSDHIFCANLRKLRKRAGLSQSEVAAKLQTLGSKISMQTYSKIETGQRNIFLSDFVLLKYVYKVNYAEFFENIETPELKKLLEDYHLD